MKVRFLLDVNAYERYIIAKYYRTPVIVNGSKQRTRATRVQVQRFVRAMLRSTLNDYEHDLDARGKAVARRLKLPKDPALEVLSEPSEKQRALPL